jgi:hypothetical protein
MESWQIAVLIGIGLVFVVILYNHYSAKAKAAAAAKTTTGQISGALKSIPGYKQVLGVAGIAEKPAAAVVNGVLNTTSAALQHIPIAGKVLAAPVKAVDSVFNGVVHSLGF